MLPRLPSRFLLVLTVVLVLLTVAHLIRYESRSAAEETAVHYVQDNKVEVSSDESTTTLYNNDEEIEEYAECHIGPHNNISTSRLPNAQILRQWSHGNDTRLGEYYAGIYLTSSYVYHDHVSVLFTSKSLYGKKVYCRYFDCKMQEIMDPFETIVFPESTALCARRRGAEYMSLSFTQEEKAQYPVKLVDRTGGYKHEFTVCVAPLHGTEPKWLQLIEFFEYYKLMNPKIKNQGVTKFFVYVVEVEDYTRKVINDYLRTNDIEVIYLFDNYWGINFNWHRNSIFECMQRAKHYSKWTASIDLDERITMNSSSKFPRIIDFLRSETDPSVISHQFKIQWVQKTEDYPPKYIDDEQVLSEVVYRKYHLTSQMGEQYEQQKAIVRADKIGSMSIHYPNLLYPGTWRKPVPTEIAWIRHYRQTKTGSNEFERAMMMKHAPFYHSNIDPVVDATLSKAILERTRFVYKDQTPPPCETQQMWYRLWDLDAPCWKKYQEKYNETLTS